MWLGLFLATGKTFILVGLAVLALGVLVYLLRAHRLHEFPFAETR